MVNRYFKHDDSFCVCGFGVLTKEGDKNDICCKLPHHLRSMSMWLHVVKQAEMDQCHADTSSAILWIQQKQPCSCTHCVKYACQQLRLAVFTKSATHLHLCASATSLPSVCEQAHHGHFPACTFSYAACQTGLSAGIHSSKSNHVCHDTMLLR